MRLRNSLASLLLLLFSLSCLAQPKKINEKKLQQDITQLMQQSRREMAALGERVISKGAYSTDYEASYLITGALKASVSVGIYSTDYSGVMGIYTDEAKASAQYDKIVEMLKRLMPASLVTKQNDDEYYKVTQFYPDGNSEVSYAPFRVTQHIVADKLHEVTIQVHANGG